MEPALHHTLERVRAAYADATPLRIHGGGSKDFQALDVQGQALDMRALQGITSYEPSELVVTVRAGTPLVQLEAALAAQGQCLAFEPPHFAGVQGAQATVGGMVAAGWSGPARASVGGVRDFVLGIEIINGKGELLRFGGQVMKNVAGYDVSRLMAGSWGTLGVITEVSLKVLPIAVGEATLRWTCARSEALRRLNTWGGQPLPLNASTWVHTQGDAQGQLWLRLRGAQAAVQAACDKLGGQIVPPDEAAVFWQGCKEQQHPWFGQCAPQDGLWRLSVAATAPVLELPSAASMPLVEWHGALRWVHAPRSAGTALRALAQAAGGDAVLFRAPAGEAMTHEPLLAPRQPALQRMHAQLKRAFDPAGILNPGRVMA